MAIACPDCGTLQDMPPPPSGSTATCPVCLHKLERTNGRSIAAALACSTATFVLLFPANLLPLLSVSILGLHRQSRLISSVTALWHGHWVIVAVLVLAFVVVLPFLRFGLLTVVLSCVRLGWRPHWLGRAFRWCLHLDHWAMPDVFLIGCAVGYSRVAVKLPVLIGAGGWCFIGAALLCMLSRATLDRRTVWRAIGAEQSSPDASVATISCVVCDVVMPATAENSPCPRCKLRLTARKPNALIRTVALTIAGFVLYLPANFYPMSVAIQPGGTSQHRIVDGIMDLYHAGFWPLAIVIFCTSVAIPAMKLIGMTWLVLSVRHESSRHLVLKTRMYRIIDEIGRWSNVDVFIVAVFVPLIHFGGLASTHPAPAITAFMLVVVFTMIASRSFDPRLVWDAGLRKST